MSKKRKQHKAPASGGGGSKGYWMSGTHACFAALENEERDILRIYATRNMAQQLPNHVKGLLEVVEGDAISRVAGEGMVHQGIAMQVMPLNAPALEDILAQGEKQPLLLLDQVTDPHNVGAIFRSAAAFGVAAIITTQDNAARESAVLAKTACGGLDMIPWVQVVNLSQAMDEVKQAGYWIAGMDGEAKQTIAEAKLGKDTALVMGAEGKGMRRLTQESCDYLIKIPMDSRMESLNVSNATAIALHQLYIS